MDSSSRPLLRSVWLASCPFEQAMPMSFFNASTPFSVAGFVPFGTGYAPFLQGKVVDMFYFPMIVTTYPSWVPFKGGDEFIFFSPVFNFADACISVGIVALFLFYRNEVEHLSETVKGAFRKK